VKSFPKASNEGVRELRQVKYILSKSYPACSANLRGSELLLPSLVLEVVDSLFITWITPLGKEKVSKCVIAHSTLGLRVKGRQFQEKLKR
jgi:hypothetical protein